MASKGKIIRTLHNTSEDVYRAEASRGTVDGATPWAAYGEFTAGGAVAHHIVHPASLGSSIEVIDPAGVQMTVVSSSVNDDGDPAGTGIQTIHIHYLDADLEEQTETLTLNGTTGVTTTATDIRAINCVHMGTVGSGGVAAGNITISNGGTDYSVITAGSLRCTSSVRRVPAGKRLMITDVWGGATSGVGTLAAILRIGTSYLNGTHDFTEDGIIMPQMSIAIQNSSVALPLSTPLVIPEGKIVALECDAEGSGCIVVGGYTGILEDA